MDDDVRERVGAGLSAIFDGKGVPTFEFIAGEDQLVLFSDLHKGARDGADEFRRSERAYNAALSYYYAAGYRLALLGDAEELWKYDPEEVLSENPHKGYRHTVELEAKFHRDAGRYIRILGNHDAEWSEPNNREKLEKIFRKVAPGSEPPTLYRAVKLVVVDEEGKHLGEIWLTHGNAGDTFSDELAGLSHFVLRTFWRPIQAKLLPSKSTTPPSVDWELREKVDIAMHDWAQNRPERPVLIAGHTHRPVHMKDLKAPPRSYEEIRQDLDHRDETDPVRPQLEWDLAEILRYDHLTRCFDSPPCYFNTGCGCNGDGDVTALEITGDSEPKLRLVRWSSADGPEERQAASLVKVLQAVNPFPQAAARARRNESPISH